MCECITKIIENLKPDHTIVTAFMFHHGELHDRMCMPIYRRDNGSPERRKTKPRSIIFTFCPVCGVEYPGGAA